MRTEPPATAGFFPGRAPIDAYGNGGFRFAGMSHKGSILCLPSGVKAWTPPAPEALDAAAFVDVLAEKDAFAFLLLGTGARHIFPTPALRAVFRDAGLGLEVMTTGSAARTYNVLLGEGRPVAAALIAVA